MHGITVTRAGRVRGGVRLAASRLAPAMSRRVRGAASAGSRVVGGSGRRARRKGMTASRLGPARSCGVGVNAARGRVNHSPSGGARGVNAAHRGAVATLATVAVATSDIGDNSSGSNTEEYKCDERCSDTHDDWRVWVSEAKSKLEGGFLLKTLDLRKLLGAPELLCHPEKREHVSEIRSFKFKRQR
jgi:hypothetical protein